MTKERCALLSGKIKGREFLFCKRFNDGEWWLTARLMVKYK